MSPGLRESGAPLAPNRGILTARLVALLLGATSIATLLLYFYGVVEMGRAVRGLLIPGVALLFALLLWARRTGRVELYRRILGGLWAGAVATLAYDVVRVPIAQSGVPVFKAISYFGTVILGEESVSGWSEAVGWLYHLSNGTGFGLMYAAMITRPRLWSAVAWGLFLECAMLVTPYAEVFGYRLSGSFFAISIGAHVVYGTALWAAMRYWQAAPASSGGAPPRFRRGVILGCAAVPLGIGAVAADFHVEHAASIPPSPPPYLGRHLYTTWDVLEPDRLAAIWVMSRFVDREARFQFVKPFTQIRRGTPFDVPEAKVRRSGSRPATEVLIAEVGLAGEPFDLLVRMARLFEITPWMGPGDPAAFRLGQEIVAAAGACEGSPRPCVERALAHLDTWYASDGDRADGG